MASIHRRTVRWTTQGGHQRTDRAAGKETLWTCATGWDAFRSPLRSPQLPGSAPACATGTTKSPRGCKAKATAAQQREFSASQRFGRTRHVATSPPGRSLPWKHKSGMRDDVMELAAIHGASKGLLETNQLNAVAHTRVTEQRRTDTRKATEGQGHGKH